MCTVLTDRISKYKWLNVEKKSDIKADRSEMSEISQKGVICCEILCYSKNYTKSRTEGGIILMAISQQEWSQVVKPQLGLRPEILNGLKEFLFTVHNLGLSFQEILWYVEEELKDVKPYLDGN